MIHSVSRHQEVCVAHCSLSCLYQQGVANEKQQVNMAPRTAVPLNLSSHQVGGVGSERDLGDPHSGHLEIHESELHETAGTLTFPISQICL